MRPFFHLCDGRLSFPPSRMSHSMLSAAWNHQCPNSTAKLVLVNLADHHNDKTGLCCPSLERLARQCGLSKKGAILQIKKLERVGALRAIRGRGRRKVNEYRFCLDSVEKVNGVHLNSVEKVNGVHLNSVEKVNGVHLNSVEKVNGVHLNSVEKVNGVPGKGERQGMKKVNAVHPNRNITLREPPTQGGVFSQSRGEQQTSQDFWRLTKRLDLINGSIAEIEARASYTAFDQIIEARDEARYRQLKSERKQIKELLRV
jgi:Helix-turn-helix domain